MMVSKADLRSFQSPLYPLKIRVLATLLLHTRAYQGDLALKMKGNEAKPFSSTDVANELSRVTFIYFHQAGVSERPSRVSAEQVRRAIVRLEETGVCERRLRGVPLHTMSHDQMTQFGLNTGVEIHVLQGDMCL